LNKIVELFEKIRVFHFSTGVFHRLLKVAWHTCFCFRLLDKIPQKADFCHQIVENCVDIVEKMPNRWVWKTFFERICASSTSAKAIVDIHQKCNFTPNERCSVRREKG